ncbi:uncharacterized protein LOC110666008 [Hevea brasiliensis]|uniref:uncharacterized protein LOC110666008 n=1 Tax=Hevea brasiliensis TaxID=3981 RepID=UPI0025DC1525|nr:uncharacterized protein LOC110666008 [Hevea brasiliensis]
MEVISRRCAVGGAALVDEIESNFRNFVHVEDVKQETRASHVDDAIDAEEELEKLEPYGENSLGNDEPEKTLPLLFSVEPTQPALPLVSAMKGSREKLGASPRKLHVSWAPDVYDPIPNTLSRTVRSKQRKFSKDKDSNNYYKKIGKKGWKVNSKGGKDKKQFRRTNGSFCRVIVQLLIITLTTNALATVLAMLFVSREKPTWVEGVRF